MITKRGLGRGLGALLASEPADAEALVEMPIDQIEVNPNQPRKVFDFTALDEHTRRLHDSAAILDFESVEPISSSQASAAGGRLARRAWIGSLQSFAKRPTRRASSSRWSRISCART